MRMQDYRNINCRCCCHVTTPSQTMYVLYRVTSAVCVLSANFSQTNQENKHQGTRAGNRQLYFCEFRLEFYFQCNEESIIYQLVISDHNDFSQNREHVSSPVDQLEIKCEASVVHELPLQDPVQCGCRCGKHVSLTFDLILPKYKTIQKRRL